MPSKALGKHSTVVMAPPNATVSVPPLSGLDDDNPLAFLVSPHECTTFTSTYWEQAPLHIPATSERADFFRDAFVLKDLMSVLFADLMLALASAHADAAQEAASQKALAKAKAKATDLLERAAAVEAAVQHAATAQATTKELAAQPTSVDATAPGASAGAEVGQPASTHNAAAQLRARARSALKAAREAARQAALSRATGTAAKLRARAAAVKTAARLVAQAEAAEAALQGAEAEDKAAVEAVEKLWARADAAEAALELFAQGNAGDIAAQLAAMAAEGEEGEAGQDGSNGIEEEEEEDDSDEDEDEEDEEDEEEEAAPLMFGTDVAAARYVEGRRESLGFGTALPDDLSQLYNKEGCTLQVGKVAGAHRCETVPKSKTNHCPSQTLALPARPGPGPGPSALALPPWPFRPGPGALALALAAPPDLFLVQAQHMHPWFHQPQRCHEGLWRLMSALEAQLGCLVGCNAYLTPPSTQGLAPHHDDVELWVCQTEGTKRWRVYAPLGGYPLPSQSSRNLRQEELGELLLDITMKVGDVLYLPRGSVHQAEAQEQGSAHLTISTYQNWNWGALAQHMMQSLPFGFHSFAGTTAQLCLPATLPTPSPTATTTTAATTTTPCSPPANEAQRVAAAAVAAGLRQLADQVEAHPQPLVAAAADAMAWDFVRHRLRPHPARLPDPGPAPGIDDGLVVRATGLFTIMPVPGQPQEGMVLLTSPLRNSRLRHMLHASKEAEEESDSDEDDSEDVDEELLKEEEEEEEDEQEEEGGKAGTHGNGKSHDHVHKSGKAGPCCSKGAADDDISIGSEDEDDDEDEDEDEDEDDDDSGDHDHDEHEDHEHSEEGEELPGELIPAAFAPAVAAVLAASSAAKPLLVRDMVALVPHKDKEVALSIAHTLWANGYAVTVPGAGAKAKKPVKAKGGADALKAAKKDSKKTKAAADGAGSAEKSSKRQKK
ncbi:hypothetical protein QJQ45_000849 [Haematococcus lacustris]|nr:hypothetical protein QJQ45_000849 [Haematococcus lacustris]